MQQQYLKLHQLEHAQLVKQAECERLVAQMQQHKPQRPNTVMLKIGELLVELGEQLQHNAYRKQPAR